MAQERVVVISGVRTPFVRARTVFQKMPPSALGGVALREVIARSDLDPALVEAKRSASIKVLGFALPCMFAGLLVLQLAVRPRVRVGLAVALLGAAIAVVVQSTQPGPWAVIVATVAGATLGLVLERWTSAPKSSR